MTKGWTGRLERSTGLYEKVLLDTLLKHEIAQCNRYGNPLAVLMLSICGTLPEDEDLRLKATTMVVHVINSNLRSSDMPGHYGDDYLILMPYTDAEGALSVGELLNEQTSELFDMPGLENLTICTGFAIHGGGILSSHQNSLSGRSRQSPNPGQKVVARPFFMAHNPNLWRC